MTPRPRSACRGDGGSVLLLGVGLMAACGLAVTVLVDVSSALLQRQRLMALADGAALAGAQAIDVASYYAEGASHSTRLDPSKVAVAVRDHLELSGGHSIVGLHTERVAADGGSVTVALNAPLQLPFFDDLLPQDIRVESTARLGYRDYRSAP